MSTRRTYEAIAAGIKVAREQTFKDLDAGRESGVDLAAHCIAGALAGDHPGFDTERFLRDAGVRP